MRIKPNKSIYSNFEEGVSLNRKPNDLFNIVYFTDVHLGINGNFRSDNVTDAIIQKLEIIKKFNIKHTDRVICGGDLFDVPRFTNNLNPKYPAINFNILNYCVDFQNQTNMVYCLGNHDYVHGPDVDYNLKKSPISLIKIKNEPHYISKSAQIFSKHWKPVFENETWLGDKNDIKIMVTHEAISKGKLPFDNYVQMETYDTSAEIVLTADIHAHQGVNIFNDTVFISTGATTRTNSSERDKMPYFAHIILREDYTLDVNFIELLRKSDDPSLYWVDVRDVKLKDHEKEDIRKLKSIDFIKEMILEENLNSNQSIDEMFEKICSKLNFGSNVLNRIKNI